VFLFSCDSQFIHLSNLSTSQPQLNQLEEGPQLFLLHLEAAARCALQLSRLYCRTRENVQTESGTTAAHIERLLDCGFDFYAVFGQLRSERRWALQECEMLRRQSHSLPLSLVLDDEEVEEIEQRRLDTATEVKARLSILLSYLKGLRKDNYGTGMSNSFSSLDSRSA